MMSPNKIKSLLVERNVQQVQIARELQISPASVNKCISGTFVSRRTRELIAQKACVPFEKMWGKQRATG